MNYGKKTINAFEDLLKYLKFLEDKKEASSSQVEELYSRAHDFLSLFLKWKSSANVSANAHQLYMQTTPLWQMLELPPTEWAEWIDVYLSNK